MGTGSSEREVWQRAQEIAGPPHAFGTVEGLSSNTPWSRVVGSKGSCSLYIIWYILYGIEYMLYSLRYMLYQLM